MELREIREELESKVTKLIPEIKATFPLMADGGPYDDNEKTFWTKGFWPGILWNLYQFNNNEEFIKTACEVEEKLDNLFKEYYMIQHDAGFVWSLTSVINYRLTQNETSRMRALKAANILAGRFNIKGNYIRAWNGPKDSDNKGWAIIDCLMNLPLLYWASEEIGDPRYRHIAMAHADMVLREFFKEDGSVYHIVRFDAETGQRIGQKSGQGYSEESAWARGQSWAVYGMALSYRYTKKARYLRAAKASAEFFINHLPEDLIPYWDFKVEPGKDVPRDASAAACAACGLLELVNYVDEETGKRYHEMAEKMVKAMYEKCFKKGIEDQGLIGYSSYNVAAGIGIDVSMIFGDYFYSEAVVRLCNDLKLPW